MSDIGVSYDLSYTPNPVGLDVLVSTNATDINITLQNVPTVAIAATPNVSGNILVSGLSVILTPLANAITLSLGLFAGQIMNGKSFKIASVSPVPYNVEGVSGKLKPKGLKLDNSDGMLLITGDFDI